MHRTAGIHGVRIHYVIGSRGAPVVLIHGFPKIQYTWRGAMPALAGEHTVIAVDLRGASSIGEAGYRKETMAEDVYRLENALGRTA